MNAPAVKPRTATVLLYQGDDRAHMEELLSEVSTAAATSGPAREGDDKRAVEAYNAFIAEAEERAVKVVLRAVPRLSYRRMVDDATKTVQRETVDAEGEKVTAEVQEVDNAALADALVPASLVEPMFDTDSQRQAFLDDLSDFDFSMLYTEALRLNRTGGIVSPKPLRLSDLTESDDETPSSPEP